MGKEEEDLEAQLNSECELQEMSSSSTTALHTAENSEERAASESSSSSNNNNSSDDDDDGRHDRFVSPAQKEHLGKSRQYWRDIILGVNDGLVSTFLLVAGVAGGGLTSNDILLTAIAGAIAGAVSMCAGEYVATKSQNEVMRGEIELEQEHVDNYLEDEVAELGISLFDLIGIPPEEKEIREQLSSFYRSHPDALLKIMTVLEFGVIEEEERSPIKAGLFSCALFLLGSLPSVIPFIFSGSRPNVGLIVAAVVTVIALLVVGVVKTWATRGNCLRAACENLLIAGVGGGFAYGVGVGFDHILH